MAAAEPADEQPAMRRWHDHDWEEVLAGRGTAERYFVRSGLVRKDRLLAFVPKARHPPTVVVRSLAELQQGLQDLGAGSAVEGIRFVLKKAERTWDPTDAGRASRPPVETVFVCDRACAFACVVL
ncbi:unnamed protein product [Effrenium voratum]|nr:unnamed protein product [Effrenium voratum]